MAQTGCERWLSFPCRCRPCYGGFALSTLSPVAALAYTVGDASAASSVAAAVTRPSTGPCGLGIVRTSGRLQSRMQ